MSAIPNVSEEAALMASFDPAEIRSKKIIDGELPGKVVRNEMHYILSRYSAARDKVNRQTAFAVWVSEALRWAIPYGHFAGYPVNFPTDIEESFIRSRGASDFTQTDMVAWCEIIDGASQIPNIYE